MCCCRCHQDGNGKRRGLLPLPRLGTLRLQRELQRLGSGHLRGLAQERTAQTQQTQELQAALFERQLFGQRVHVQQPGPQPERVQREQQRQQQRAPSQDAGHAQGRGGPQIQPHGPEQDQRQRQQQRFGVQRELREFGERRQRLQQQRERLQDTAELLHTQPVQAARFGLLAAVAESQPGPSERDEAVRHEHHEGAAGHLRADVGGGREHIEAVADGGLCHR